MSLVPRAISRLGKRRLAGLVLGWSATIAAAQTATFEKPLSLRTASYDIKVTLDDEARRVSGDIVLTWNNPSDDHVDDLQFHLYANAFKNARSTRLREVLHSRASRTSGGDPDDVPWKEDEGWGWVRITRMVVDGEDVTERIEFFQPDDDNVDDQTVIRVPLPSPIAPRAAARIEMTFESKIPQCHVRTGWWQDDFFMMAHWFPKIGVYEPPGTRFVPADAPRGQWNCHQFHAATEFYADFGVYDVQITLPAKYVVGTSGQMLEQRVNDDDTKTIIARAEDVHEFAWVADAQFFEANELWRSADTGQEVQIRLLYQPDHENVVEKYINSTKLTLDYMDLWLGPGVYPYPNVTVVDPRKGSAAGGMEYPTLFTGGAWWAVEAIFGDGLRVVEQVTVHEFLHQFWFAIVATNEFEEAWLDEGLTVYTQDRIMSELYGEKTSLMDWWGAYVGSVDATRISYAGSSTNKDGTLSAPTFSHWRASTAFGLSYNKAATMYKTLENYLGLERFDQVMRTFYQRWQFRHPCGEDLIATFNEVAGEDLNWFFDQFVRQTVVLDYAVASIANVPLTSIDQGLLGNDLELSGHEEDEGQSAEQEEEDDGPYESTVVFRRVGEAVFPMETLIEFADGRIEHGTWDGHSPVKVYRFAHPAKVVRAVIDPDHRVLLDVDRLNNSLRIEENEFVTNKYTLKGFFWIQSLLQFFSILG